MKDPELCGPHEWADDFRTQADAADMCGDHMAWHLTPTDCREIADRMDDLTEAIGLLRSVFQIPGWTERAKALLTKYEED